MRFLVTPRRCWRHGTSRAAGSGGKPYEPPAAIALQRITRPRLRRARQQITMIAAFDEGFRGVPSGQTFRYPEPHDSFLLGRAGWLQMSSLRIVFGCWVAVSVLTGCASRSLPRPPVAEFASPEQRPLYRW